MVCSAAPVAGRDPSLGCPGAAASPVLPLRGPLAGLLDQLETSHWHVFTQGGTPTVVAVPWLPCQSPSKKVPANQYCGAGPCPHVISASHVLETVLKGMLSFIGFFVLGIWFLRHSGPGFAD